MILVLVDQITERVKYTFDFIFFERELNYTLTTSFNEFEEHPANKRLNYSSHQSVNRQIVPARLLFESEILAPKIKKVKFEGEECLSFDEVIDPVASIFYVLSRYEEYNNSNLDQHQRFKFKNSVLAKFKWVDKAVCDRWATEIINFINVELLMNYTIKRTFLGANDIVVPTFDIDNTYAYKEKSGKRKLGAIVNDIIKWRRHRLEERKRVLQDGNDPYDTFQMIKKIAQQYRRTKVFWLVKSSGSKFDRNLSIKNENHRALIREMSELCEIGLHPSYQSFQSTTKILEEKRDLENVTNSSLSNSRFHFLRFNLPESYKSILHSEFTDEYSMGFAEHYGFRSGTARKHLWFDLTENRATQLTIHPFAYMDGTLNEYMSKSIKESKKIIDKLYAEIKTYGGDMICIWHNETIGDYGKWKGWSEVLDYNLNIK